MVVPTHSVAYRVGTAEQSSREGWVLQSSMGNCWTGREGTCTPLDQPQPQVELAVNSGAGAVHSPWSSSLVKDFSAAACSSISVSSGSEVEIRHDLPWVFLEDSAMHEQNFSAKHPPHQTYWVSSLFRILQQGTSTKS